MVQRCGRDIEMLKRRLDRYQDNWRSLPMVLPHPKRKIEQKRGPKPKTRQEPTVLSHNSPPYNNAENLPKMRKQRMRKTDKDAGMNQQEAILLRQQQQQKRQERQREQQAMKLAAQQQRQLLRQQKQIAAQQLKQQRQLERQQQRFNMQQQKKQMTPTIAGTVPTNTISGSPHGRFATKVSTTFLTPQRNINIVNTAVQSITGDVIMPPPPPPPKVDHHTDQPAHILLMHRPLQITTLKNQQKPKIP